MSKTLVVAMAAIALGALAQPALARDSSAPLVLKVDSARVDFGDPVAVKAFYAKLSRAAATVCNSNSSNPQVDQQDRVCADQSLMLAVKTVDQPMLTQLHDRIHVRTPSRLAANYNQKD